MVDVKIEPSWKELLKETLFFRVNPIRETRIQYHENLSSRKTYF